MSKTDLRKTANNLHCYDIHWRAILHGVLIFVVQLWFAFLVDNNDNNENDYLNTDTNEWPQRSQLVYNGKHKASLTSHRRTSFTS